MRVCLMIEGQEDVRWDHWLALADTCERGGFHALFRSDHYASVGGHRERGSLDAWATLAGLAAVTSTLRLGTLVSPGTFRHPSLLAKNVTTVDHISGGRVELGMGAGWYEPEHTQYGFPFLDTKSRFDKLTEQIEIVHRSWTEDRFTFEGDYYSLVDNNALPKPVQKPHPPLIVGGNGGPRGIALAARWATEYNTLMIGPDECGVRRDELDDACKEIGRDGDTLPLSLMCSVLIGADHAELRKRASALIARRGTNDDPDDFLANLGDRWVAGTPDQVIDRLRDLRGAGVERVMLQHLLHDDTDAVELIGKEVIPAVG